MLAGGRDSRGDLPHLSNAVLAARIGTEVAEFPGGHTGYATHPVEFAARLADVLAVADAGRRTPVRSRREGTR